MGTSHPTRFSDFNMGKRGEISGPISGSARRLFTDPSAMVFSLCRFLAVLAALPLFLLVSFAASFVSLNVPHHPFKQIMSTFSHLTLKSYSQGACSAETCSVCLTWSPKSSETHAVNLELGTPPRAVKIRHFVTVLPGRAFGRQSQPEVDCRSHLLGSVLPPGSWLPACRPRAARSVQGRVTDPRLLRLVERRASTLLQG